MRNLLIKQTSGFKLFISPVCGKIRINEASPPHRCPADIHLIPPCGGDRHLADTLLITIHTGRSEFCGVSHSQTGMDCTREENQRQRR